MCLIEHVQKLLVVIVDPNGTKRNNSSQIKYVWHGLIYSNPNFATLSIIVVSGGE